MRRVYTLRRLFRDGVRGKADLDEAIRHGDAPTRGVAIVAAFWVKLNNDWIFNLAGLLAYNFLMALFPLLFLVLAGCGLVLQVLRALSCTRAHPGSRATAGPLAPSSCRAWPRTSRQARAAPRRRPRPACLAGSRLFVTLEGCFGIVFRLRGRDPLRQNRMAFGCCSSIWCCSRCCWGRSFCRRASSSGRPCRSRHPRDGALRRRAC